MLPLYTTTLQVYNGGKFYTMANLKSIAELLQMIADADNTNTGVVDWNGVNGEKEILQQIAALIRARSIITYPSAEALALASSIDSYFAVIPDENNGGLNFFKWYPNIDASVFGAITSSASGQWRPIFAVSTPVAGPWTTNGDNDIIPNTGLNDAGVAIGKSTVAEGLWMDFADTDSLGFGRGVKLPALSTNQINTKTLVSNEFFYNKDDNMLLRYDSGTSETKSAGVLSGIGSEAVDLSSTGIVVTFPASQHVNNYKVQISPNDEYSGRLLADTKYYITNKTTSTFRIAFPVVAASAGTLNFDYTISH